MFMWPAQFTIVTFLFISNARQYLDTAADVNYIAALVGLYKMPCGIVMYTYS